MYQRDAFNEVADLRLLETASVKCRILAAFLVKKA